jgi:hypothetical protein
MTSTKKVKSLRYIHMDIANEIKANPKLVPKDIVYRFLKLNPYRLKDPEKRKINTFTPTPPSKHYREQKEFFRGVSPVARYSPIDYGLKTPIKRNALVSIEDSNSKQSSQISAINGDLKDIYEDIDSNLNENYLYQTNDYRKRYDKIFRGKISKNYLNYRN